jgi:hypothetical protein
MQMISGEHSFEPFKRYHITNKFKFILYCRGVHAILKVIQEFSCAHPNLFQFIKVIKDISSTKMQEIRSIKDGISKRPISET